MKLELYAGHLPGSLGLLKVHLTAGDIVVEYASPGAEAPEKVESLQAAVDLDLAEEDVINRLNYASHLNGIIAAKIKAKRKEAEKAVAEARQGGKVDPLPSGTNSTIPITIDNVDQLPASMPLARRNEIRAKVGAAPLAE